MLTRMTVRDFRCLASVEVEPHPRLTFVVGRNAQGKTSLLEAVCVLMRLQSPRTSTRSDWLRFGAESCLIEGVWEQHLLRHAQTKSSRRLAVNGAVCSRAAEYLSASALVVWLDHADMNLARGGAEHRRRHLDFTAAQLFPEYLTALRQYDRALRARNFLLKRDINISWRQVDAHGVIMDKNSAIIVRCRRELVRRIQPWIADAQLKLSGAAEAASAVYAPGFEGDSLLAALENMRDAESRTRQTAVGTHRDDLLLSVGGRDAGAFASEGQQRTLCLALKLAQARVLEEEKGVAPLLLLDDVFGELDPERRQALLDYLPRGSQKIVTTTALHWMTDESSDASILRVEDGNVRSVD